MSTISSFVGDNFRYIWVSLQLKIIKNNFSGVFLSKPSCEMYIDLVT